MIQPLLRLQQRYAGQHWASSHCKLTNNRKKYNRDPAQILLRWSLQKGYVLSLSPFVHISHFISWDADT